MGHVFDLKEETLLFHYRSIFSLIWSPGGLGGYLYVARRANSTQKKVYLFCHFKPQMLQWKCAVSSISIYATWREMKVGETNGWFIQKWAFMSIFGKVKNRCIESSTKSFSWCKNKTNQHLPVTPPQISLLIPPAVCHIISYLNSSAGTQLTSVVCIHFRVERR